MTQATSVFCTHRNSEREASNGFFSQLINDNARIWTHLWLQDPQNNPDTPLGTSGNYWARNKHVKYPCKWHIVFQCQATNITPHKLAKTFLSLYFAGNGWVSHMTVLISAPGRTNQKPKAEDGQAIQQAVWPEVRSSREFGFQSWLINMPLPKALALGLALVNMRLMAAM